jgi:c-di-GMP-binding flagellar brake protein YcgR
MIKKRRSTRIPISGIANIEFKDHGKIHSIQTVIANVSLRGMGVYAYNSIKIKTHASILITFVFSDGSLRTDSLTGRIISNKKIQNTYFLSVQFDEEIDPENQPYLSNYLLDSWEALFFH